MPLYSWYADLLIDQSKDEFPLDARGIPTSECPLCGTNIFLIRAIFSNEYEIAMYALDGECSECGTLLTVPTPKDLVT